MTTKGARGYLQLAGRFILCPNPDCRRETIVVALYEAKRTQSFDFKIEGLPKGMWRLVPDSKAKVFPDYVPEAIRADYTEACRIVALSPKAAATLARRALQGMIRDF
jgi:hypothetical protein